MKRRLWIISSTANRAKGQCTKGSEVMMEDKKGTGHGV